MIDMQRIYLNNQFYDIAHLPSEPSLLVELLNLCHDDNANFEKFTQLIKQDVGLTSKILQVANSPAYRQWNDLNDIRRVLIVLGLTNVRQIVTTCAIQQFFAKFTKNFSRQVQHIWLRSLLCANLAERFARLVGYEKTGEAFLAGLLHQVGMLLLLLNREADYLPLLDRYYQKTDEFHNLEREMFKVNHCELGAALLETWQLDSFIADALLFQRSPVSELHNAPLLLKILSVTSALSSRNNARENQTYLAKAGELFDLSEASTLNCLDAAVATSQKMISDLGFAGRFYLCADETDSFFDTEAKKNNDNLAQQVKNIALSHAGFSHAVNTEKEFASLARSCFSSLFNLDRICIFRHSPDTTKLTAINDLKQSKLDEIYFLDNDPQSLLSHAYMQRKQVSSSETPGTIADRQLARILDSDDLLLLPLLNGASCLGVAALGHQRTDQARLAALQPLLSLIGQELATSWQMIQKTGADSQTESTAIRELIHEISNPLTIINNYLYTLGAQLDASNQAQEQIRTIRAEIDRVGAILLRAKDPTRSIPTRITTANINKLLIEIDQLLKSSLYKTTAISSQLQLDQSVPPLACDHDKLKQIIINLLKNSVEAMPDGGSIEIMTRDNVYQNGKPSVQISIKDSGPGISEEILANLFSPVNSTKDGHSGIGLTIVNNLVKELNAEIFCYSSGDQGTEFSLYIPRNF